MLNVVFKDDRLCWFYFVADDSENFHNCQLTKESEKSDEDKANSGIWTLFSKIKMKSVSDLYPAKDCHELYKKGERTSGVYNIDPDSQGNFSVFCEMTRSDGGWTVFQRRQDGSVDFYRDWKDYKNGFGDLKGEFWLGLDKIHRLTTAMQTKLRIFIKGLPTLLAPHPEHTVEYDNFVVKNEIMKYELSIGRFSGSTQDSLSHHNGMAFSTKDSDNDATFLFNCAVKSRGAWWYRGCYQSNLNGYYKQNPLGVALLDNWDGMAWFVLLGNSYSITYTEMKLKPYN